MKALRRRVPLRLRRPLGEAETKRCKGRVPRRHTKRCAVEAVSANIRHFICREGWAQPRAVAASLAILKKACGVKSTRRMTPKQIVASRRP